MVSLKGTMNPFALLAHSHLVKQVYQALGRTRIWVWFWHPISHSEIFRMPFSWWLPFDKDARYIRHQLRPEFSIQQINPHTRVRTALTMRSSTYIASLGLILTSASAVLFKRQGSCPDNSINSLSSPFVLTGVHRQSGSSPRFVPLFSTPGVLYNSTTLSIASSDTPTFTLDSGILSTSDGVPCYLYQGLDWVNYALFICSSDTGLEDPVVNTLTGASWATGTQCLGVDMEVVVLVPVIDGMRHSKRV